MSQLEPVLPEAAKNAALEQRSVASLYMAGKAIIAQNVHHADWLLTKGSAGSWLRLYLDRNDGITLMSFTNAGVQVSSASSYSVFMSSAFGRTVTEWPLRWGSLASLYLHAKVQTDSMASKYCMQNSELQSGMKILWLYTTCMIDYYILAPNDCDNDSCYDKCINPCALAGGL